MTLNIISLIKNQEIMKKAFLILFMISSIIGYSQSVNFEKTYDNPQMGVMIIPLPCYMEISGGKPDPQTLSMGWGFAAMVDIKDRYMVDLFLNKPYSLFNHMFDFGYYDASDGIFDQVSNNEPVHYSHFELGGRYHLRNKITKPSTQITLWSSSSTSGRVTTTHTKFFNTPALQRNSFSARGGFYRYKTALTAYSSGGDGGGVMSTDSTLFGNSAPLGHANFNKDAVTNMFVNGVYAGISSTKCKFVKTSVRGYGKRNNIYQRSWYFDILMASPRIEDFEGNGGNTWDVTGDGAEGFETKALGWRLGIDWAMRPRWFGIFLRSEMGSKPGLKDSKFYFMGSFGIMYNFPIEPISHKYSLK